MLTIYSDTLDYGAAIPSSIIHGSSVKFDPSSMTEGDTHTIEVGINDNGQPTLIASDTIQFRVATRKVTDLLKQLVITVVVAQLVIFS
jgi:hypothetical protein|tara:strand:- start:410 stop:673 length:264 start_codon:yes stop_codon:yes gene_type:complete